MKITVLIENTSQNPSILSEHGLSLYIETENHKLLSDCGCTDAVLKNAVTLGIDLTEVDSVFLSHGHYDHSGGILPFAEQNPNALIYMQQTALLPYYHKSPLEERYIGINSEIAKLPQLRLLSGDIMIDKELSVFTNVTGRTLWPKGNLELKKKMETSKNVMEKIEDMFVQDEFDHEQYLVITESLDSSITDNNNTFHANRPLQNSFLQAQNNIHSKKVLISGCAHNGILNILEHYHSLYTAYPDAVISGFHMRKKTDYTQEDVATIKETAKRLSTLPTKFYTGHCTGEYPFALMKEIMGKQLIYAHSGDSILF